MNDIFAEHSWYFRNAQLRANYTNLQKGVHETTEYLELFLRNLLLGEKNELKNRSPWWCVFVIAHCHSKRHPNLFSEN